MKLSLSAIVASSSSIFTFTEVQAFSGAEIEAKWAISNPETEYDPVTNTFTMIYPDIDDTILADNFRVKYFDKNCKDPVDNSDGVAPPQYVLDKGIDDITRNMAKPEQEDVPYEEQVYTFPTVTSPTDLSPSYGFGYGDFVHGLCVLGSSSATAVSSDTAYTYVSVSDFGSGTKLWGDKPWVAMG